MESLEKRRKATNKIIDDIEKVGERVKKQSGKVQDQAVDKIIEKNPSATPFVTNSVVSQQINNSVRRIIVYTEDSFEDIIKKTQQYLAEGYDINLSTANLKAISQAESTIIDKLINNTDILKTDIKRILYSNLGKGLSQRQLVRELKELYPAYKSNAGTIINTGAGRLFQDINTTKFAESGFNWYIWAGPLDKITREQPCQHWTNHKFPASQLDVLRSTRQSLWNCRHSILPITDEEAKDYPLGNISFAIA